MSQTLNSVDDRSNSSRTAYLELSRMLREGRSWSGRERNNAFLNTRDGRFANVAATTGFDFPDDARAVSVVDWDGDGDQDVWVSNRNEPRLRLLRNDAPPTAAIALLLEGNGKSTNTQAIGARVRLETTASTKPLVRAVRAGEGYLAQSSRWLHLGMAGTGTGTTVTRLTVHWPGGDQEEFTGVQSSGRHRLVQGSGRAELLPARLAPSALRPSTPSLPPPSSVARIPLVTLLRWPRPLPYSRFDGTAAALEPAPGRALLVNLFASWCAPCATELEGLTREASRLKGAGIEVMALAVDGLGDDRSDPAQAAQLIARLQFPFAAGRASSALLSVLEALNNSHVALHRPLPIPTSFLIDAAGQLCAIYKGPTDATQVIRDLSVAQGSRQERWLHSAPLGGSALTSTAVTRAALESEASQRFLFALGLSGQGRFEDARAHYEDLVALKPDFPEAQNNLGLALFRLGKDAEAERALLAALAIRADLAEAHFNLAALYDRRGDLVRAEAEYRETLRLKPSYAGAHNAWGLVCAKTGRLTEAREHFEREVALSPDLAEAHNNLGLVALHQGRDPEAQRCFESALRLEPAHADAHNNLGVVCKRQGRLDEAIRHYQQAVATQPRFAEAWNNLGLAHQSAGRGQEARLAFEQALAADPAFAPAAQNLKRLETKPGP